MPSMEERQLSADNRQLSKTDCSQCLELPVLSLQCGPKLQNRDCKHLPREPLLTEQMVDCIEPSGKLAPLKRPIRFPLFIADV